MPSALGKRLAKMTPVSSRRAGGKSQRSGRNLPVVVWRYVCTRGMPASRRASSPAAIASWLVMSSASTSFSGTPYSSVKSNEPGRPASLMTSSGSVMTWKLPSPSSDLTTRVMRFSTILRRKRSGMRSMNDSPRRMRRALSGSITDFSAPGNPRPVPLITTEPRGGSLRS